MITSQQLAPGMTIAFGDNLYRVESSVKVTVPKGSPFIKAKLKDLINEDFVEKKFKLGQKLNDVSLQMCDLEFLYTEDNDYLFLDVNNLDQILVPQEVIGDRAYYLKEGVEIQASFYGDIIFSVELPQFLELMVAETQEPDPSSTMSDVTKDAVLETGAKVKVPLFIDVGDVIKVETKIGEFVQRI
ncbi:elongation factor P [Simkania negevensis]|uniref:Elongation factor P n=1 Tax=Simkania negevensis TaxID=83561 RepID=A0ABS3ATD2_9BACT|nr:elongation factor P [Simkania negevensis]